MTFRPNISIVVPFHNEEANIPLLYREIVQAMAGITGDYELVFVDDKSTDGTVGAILELARQDPRIVCVKLRRNHGQTGALAAGFDHAAGDIVVSMDGDLQHDPADIPALLRPVQDDAYDIASGWRKERIDPFLSRKLPSRIANWIMAKFSGLEIHDFGTTFKAYRRNILSQVRLYGDLHRFIPALALAYGARVLEVPINSRRRQHGKSHYTITRTFRVMFDLITIRFLLKYLTRPLHFFGRPGLVCFFGGMGVGLFLVAKKLIIGGDAFTQHAPLLIFAVLMVLAGVQLLCFGLLGEMLTRVYFESSRRTIYAVENVIRHENLVQIGYSGCD
ncbi:MAG TPA: glycosyltransferase family 2 protein [Acidobacteriota bacterium]|jgi:glycosyltransferase involved in cell wall biosynthesis|nr:glycosyltransferase family 2 protein [Acidobacteriota bacterium]HQP73731.1 glycosyltransferase family 2 protein [Acidobacteriota bacterium]